MPSLSDHVRRDAGASMRADFRLWWGLIERRGSEIAKAKIAAYDAGESISNGTVIGREAAREALEEITGLSIEALEAALTAAPDPAAIEAA